MIHLLVDLDRLICLVLKKRNKKMLIEIGKEISREDALDLAKKILEDSEEGRKTIADLESEKGIDYNKEEKNGRK